ncbi:MAG: MFS transporter [Burkholderiales bacterium]|nr:MFS transporter [Burkholderiales bacterium]
MSRPVPSAAAPTAAPNAAESTGWRYGLLGLPLAFVALPLYVHLPHHYASAFNVPLAWLGAMLLGARVFDALIDPALGRWVDRLQARSPRQLLRVCALAAVVLALGLQALFMPWFAGSPAALAVWALLLLLPTCAACSLLGMAHQGWGSRLGGDAVQRSRIVAWREGLGLVGVVLASVLPAVTGLPWMVGACAATLAMGWIAWWQSPWPAFAPPQTTTDDDRWRPWRHSGFRRLAGVYALNGMASAVPATLVLFYIQDRLAAPAHWAGVLLGSYFLSAALAMPLWLRAVQHLGLARSWALGMALAIAAFAAAAVLGAGDAPWFVLVCLASGVALGADLVLPPALLAGVIANAGDRGRHDGIYFGWWQVLTKLNLALAAGTVLPLLGALGYTPGQADPQGLRMLGLAYAVLPCALKAGAALALYAAIIQPARAQEALP